MRADPEEVNNWNVFGLGLSLTAIILLCCVVWTMVTLAAIDRPSQRPALNIEVTGSNGGGRCAI